MIIYGNVTNITICIRWEHPTMFGNMGYYYHIVLHPVIERLNWYVLMVEMCKYSRTPYERPLVFTMENDRKSRVATQSNVDLGEGH